MSPGEDRLAVLRRMRKEGRITHEEYDELALSYRPRDEVSETVAEVNDDELAPSEHDLASSEQPAPTFELSLRRDLSSAYTAGLAIAAVALIVAAWLGAVPWVVSLSLVALLATTLFEGLQVVTRIGAIVVAVIVIVGVISTLGGGEETPPIPQAAPTPPPDDPHPEVPGSLDVYMDQVAELWNSVDSPPQIVRGLTRHNEIGEYDTFLYRFGAWGRVAGAFDPDSEVLYALLAAGQLSGEATDQLYLHLCFMVAPFSPECIDSYQQIGLGGASLDDFLDVTHEAEWTLGEHTWRLEIDQNVMTIRVYGADAI